MFMNTNNIVHYAKFKTYDFFYLVGNLQNFTNNIPPFSTLQQSAFVTKLPSAEVKFQDNCYHNFDSFYSLSTDFISITHTAYEVDPLDFSLYL